MATARENERLCETISELKGVINTASTALAGNTEASTEIYSMIAKTLEELVKKRGDLPEKSDIYIHYDYDELKKLYAYYYWCTYYYYYYGYGPKETVININITRSKK
jgi:hypothetical protein